MFSNYSVFSDPKQCSLQKVLIVSSPQGVRTGSHDYYKKQLENAYQIIHNLTDSPLPIEDVPDLLPYSKVTKGKKTKRSR